MLTIMSLALLAQVPAPVPGDDVVMWLLQSVKWIVEQFQQKNYVPAMGMLVMVLVFIFNKFFAEKVKKEHLPLLSAGLGVLTAVCTNLIAMAVGATPMDWLQAISSGLTVGAAASGFWSLLGKKVMEKLAPKKE